MAVTYQNLRDQTTFWFTERIAPLNHSGWSTDIRHQHMLLQLAVIDDREAQGMPVGQAADSLVAELLFAAQVLHFLDKEPSTPTPFPSVAVSTPLPSAADMASRIPVQELVDYLYAESLMPDDRGILACALQAGQLQNTDIAGTYLLLAESQAELTITSILNSALATGKIELPEHGLAFKGLAATEIEFLIGIYVAAFDRAPDHEGLAYWAASLVDYMEATPSVDDAYKSIAGDIYRAGAQNSEAGTQLSSHDYVHFVYETVLGRAPETAGLAYWVQGLDSFAVERPAFIATFLTSAMQSEGDDVHVLSRIQVAAHAVQVHGSGTHASALDLHGVLHGVTDQASALAAIVRLGIPDGGIDIAAHQGWQKPDQMINAAGLADPDLDVVDLAHDFYPVDIAEVKLVGMASSTWGKDLALLDSESWS